MQTITLQYVSGVNQGVLPFLIYGAKEEDCLFYNRLHLGLNGNYSEKPLRYRRKFTVYFMPLFQTAQYLYNLGTYPTLDSAQYGVLYFMYSFMNAPTQIVTESPALNMSDITLIDSTLRFEYLNNIDFAAAFTMEFVEPDWTNPSDTGSTRILKPVYTPVGTGISGETFTVYCNLIDWRSIEVFGKSKEYVDESSKFEPFGYRHLITIDTGVITSETQRNWIRDFICWQNKQIDLTGVDSVNGKVYDVVFDGKELIWEWVNGISDNPKTVLEFKEKNKRAVSEEYISPPSTEFILDTDILDSSTAVLG